MFTRNSVLAIYAGLGFTGHDVLLINGISGAWQVVVVWIFITFIGETMMDDFPKEAHSHRAHSGSRRTSPSSHHRAHPHVYFPGLAGWYRLQVLGPELSQSGNGYRWSGIDLPVLGGFLSFVWTW